MSSVRAFKASDGALFEDYQAFVQHEESLKFDELWEKHLSDQFDHEAQEELVKSVVKDNADLFLEVLQGSKVKKRGRGNK